MSEQNELTDAIVSVIKAVGGLKKKGKYSGGKTRYDFHAADDVLEAVGREMANHGVVILPAVLSANVSIQPAPYDKSLFLAIIDMEMTVRVGNTESTHKWVGAGNDYSTPDKAVYKAQTSGHKYFLMKLFMIGDGNGDGEHEPPYEGRKNTPARKPAQNGKPFYQSIADKIPYYKHAKHVEATMKKEGWAYPTSPATAKEAEKALTIYAETKGGSESVSMKKLESNPPNWE